MNPTQKLPLKPKKAYAKQISCIFHLIKSCLADFFVWCKQIRDEIEVEKKKRGRKKKSDLYFFQQFFRLYRIT